MLTADGCAQRRAALRELLPEIDLFVVSRPEHIFYLSGFLADPMNLASYGLNFLLIDSAGKTQLITDNWNAAAAQAAFVAEREVWSWYDFRRPAGEKYAAAAARLAELFAQRGQTGRIGVEAAQLPLLAGQALGTVAATDIGPTLQAMRRAKDADEIACIEHAIRATEAGHAAARASIQAGRSELEIYSEIQAAIVQAAGRPIVMLGDFAGGARSSTGGGPPTGNRLQAGDLMICDLFPLIGGYRADITNTLCAGEPSAEQARLMAAAQAALQAGERTLRAGITGGEVYAACHAALAAAGLADHFPHHAGHGLGLGHPEPPYLVPESDEALAAGDVVTLEPGVYLPGIGGVRIEHCYLIEEAGARRLSQHQLGF